jgi:C-terminal processing protease CtpA/Prc
MDLKKVAFITTKGTASASEMVINSLQPFVDVSIIGDTTYGKPVGMNAKNICPFELKGMNRVDYTF